MHLDRTVKINDLLTAAALLLSAVTLTFSWSKERALQTRQDADRVRSAAAKCVAKLDRWHTLHLAVFDELQSAYVQTSERVAAAPSDVGAARDFLWKEITATHSRASTKVSDEQIETAYGELVASFPPMRHDFVATLEQLRHVDEKSLEQLLLDTQSAVLNVELKDYSPPVLGNALRGAAARARAEFVAGTQPILENMRNKLFDIVQRDDSVLVEGARAPLAERDTR